MKSTEMRITELNRCPLCGRMYSEHPAISRTDNVTPICPDCGIRQALASIGIAHEEQETILGIIRRNEQRIRNSRE